MKKRNPQPSVNKTLHKQRNYSRLFSTSTLLLAILTLFTWQCKKDKFTAETKSICPLIIQTDPINGATNVPLNKVITATFNEPMNPATINVLTYQVRLGNNEIAGKVTTVGANAVFTPTMNLLANTKYTGIVSVGPKDLDGNSLQEDYIWSFTTGVTLDSISPLVVTTDPANLATNVPLNKIVSATFSETMDPSSIDATSFLLQLGTTTVPGAISYAGFTATYKPSANLLPNSTYKGTITTSARDASGNTLASNYIWTFTTGTTADTVKPKVISTDPANLATNVPLNKIVSATFSKSMDPLTINSTSFLLKAGSVTVPGNVTYSGVTAVYKPTANLTPNTLYTGTITTASKDLSGNAIAADYIWTFTTGISADTTRPLVISTDPTNLATSVPLNKIISAVFSENMDPSSITNTTFLLKIGTTAVTGNVTYAGVTATFTPTTKLLSGTKYTATITTGAKDVAGNTLAANYVWTFTTVNPLGPLFIDLDCAGDFAVLAGSTVTNTGPTIVDGDIGLSPSTSVTGFPPGTVINGAIHVVDTKAANAKGCLTTAYNDGAGRSLNAIVNSTGELGGLTLAPGLYVSAPGSFAMTNSDLTLDAQGDVNAIWIFQMPSSTLTVGNGLKVILANGANPNNIFWIVGTSATIGTTAVMKGNILADQSITLQTGATLDGRVLARIAAVTLDTNLVTKP